MEDADILICDINLGNDRAGFSLISNLPKPMRFGRLVFLTAYDEIYLIRKAKELGACAYVRKDTPMETLVSVLDDLNESFRFIAPGLSDNYLELVDRQDTEVNLSKRELEVMQLVMDGLSSSQIGDRLFTSRTTIETHRRNIYRKTKATNVLELSRIALRNGWLSAE
jgi:DNA-binding NarL/FixJ family response regulator